MSMLSCKKRTRSCGNSTVGRIYLSRMHEALSSIPRTKRKEAVERNKRKEEEGTEGGKKGGRKKGEGKILKILLVAIHHSSG